MQSDGDVMLEAGVAARRLGVSPSGMRRLAVIYEQVCGDLPRKSNAAGEVSHTSGRLYPGEALERLEAARAMVAAERYPTIREALHGLMRGEPADMPRGVATGSQGGSGEALGALLAELREVRAELAALRSEVATLRALPGGERLPAVEGRGAGEDGPAVRVVRWLERRLRGGRG